MDNYAYQPDENNGRPFAITRYPTTRNGRNDYLVEVNSRAKYFKKPGVYKRISIVLLLLALVFLIGLIVLLVMYFRGKPKICTSSECLRAATNLKLSLDLSVNPCENFYQFTCGRWSEEHPNHGWYPIFTAFTTISERIAISAMNFFVSPPANDEPMALKLARNFYESCMDADSIDAIGLTVVYKYLKKSGLPEVPSMFVKTEDELKSFSFNWLKTETTLRKTFFMDVFFGFAVDANIYNRSENVMFIGYPIQKCPLPSPIRSTKRIRNQESYVRTAVDIEKRNLIMKTRAKIIKFVIQTIMKNSSLAEPKEELLDEAAAVINNITNVIEDFAVNFTVFEEMEYKSVSIDDFQKITDESLKGLNHNFSNLWSNYIDYMFEDSKVKINKDKDMLHITEIEGPYIPLILKYILKLSDVQLELYMWWITVYAMIINTTTDIVEYISKQTAPFYLSSENEITRARSLDCSAVVNTYMGMALSYAIADRNFPNSTKPKVQHMLEEIKEAFVDRVNEIKWMDHSTKLATLEKSKEMLSFIGYPDWLYEKGSIDAYYEDIDIEPDTYLENMINFLKEYFPEKLESLREQNDRNWTTDPTNVNAFNSFPDNAINVPMAILNFPMYNLGLEVLHYGSIGSILGHELTHGFDNTGRKHDKYGNYVKWWTNKTIETFENLTDCFVNQYNNFTMEGVKVHVNGRQTLGENLADNGGLNQAFVAYQNYVKKNGEEPKLPGFENYTSSQLFFLAYGSIWCETSNPEDLEYQIENDEHSPNAIRVLGSLQNSEEFAQAYSCPKGSFMNPNKQKCKIW